jgi:phosphatidylglycerol---prolipoprotein diacylglyceryl transferase
MIPYLEAPSLGPVNSFGVLVMLGVLFGAAAAYRHAERLGLDPVHTRRLALVCGICGLLGAHLVDLFLYQPGWADQEGAIWRLLNPFAGISSYGGLIGATLGFVLFAHVSGLEKLRYADAAIVGGLVLLTFGRAGCASVHDHIGVATEFPLAVEFPPGNPGGVVGPHHDLGLYEFVLLLGLLTITASLIRTPRRPGWLVGFVAVFYSVPRFFLDFLRSPSSDPRYFELTPAQWSSIAAFLAGAGVLVWVYTIRESPPEKHVRPTPWRRYFADFVRLRGSAHRA